MVEKFASCTAFYDTIRCEGTTVKWECNTLGFHKHKCESAEEAKALMEKMKAVSLAFNCGEIGDSVG